MMYIMPGSEKVLEYLAESNGRMTLADILYRHTLLPVPNLLPMVVGTLANNLRKYGFRVDVYSLNVHGVVVSL